MRRSTRGRGPILQLTLFMLVSALVSTYLAVVLGNIDFSSQRQFAAVFTDVSGLTADSPVRIAGVDVGQVDDVSIYHGNEVKVGFSVDSAVTLSTRTQATVRYKNLIGDRYLDLSGGNDGPPLTTGATIPANRTAPALDLDVLLNGFKPLFTGLDPRAINAVSEEIVHVFQGESGTITSLLTTVASLTGTLADRDQLIGSVIDNLNTTLQTVSTNGADLDTLIVQLQQLITGLAADRDPIGNALVHLNGLATTAADLLTTVRPDLKTDISKLGTLATTLNQSSDTLTMVLGKLPHTYQVLSRLGAYGNFFNFYLCSSRFRFTLPNGTQYLTPASKNPAARCQ